MITSHSRQRTVPAPTVNGQAAPNAAVTQRAGPWTRGAGCAGPLMNRPTQTANKAMATLTPMSCRTPTQLNWNGAVVWKLSNTERRPFRTGVQSHLMVGPQGFEP